MITALTGGVTDSFGTLQSAFATGMTDMVSNTFGMVAVLVPVVLPLLGASIAIAYGLKFIRRIIK